MNYLLHSLNLFSVVMFRADKREICSEKKMEFADISRSSDKG